MSTLGARSADRVESFVAAIDTYEPSLLSQHEDEFRVFARFISRSIDGRYLERHPTHDLLPDLEQLMAAALVRGPDEIRVRLTISPHSSGHRGVLTTCMQDQLFIFSAVRLGLEHLGVRYYRSLNSVIPIGRNSNGEILSVGLVEETRESFIWLEVEDRNLEQRREEIESYLTLCLEAARMAVLDFSAMGEAVQALAKRFEELAQTRPDQRQAHEDNARFLRWLLDDHFVFLGTRYLPSNRHQRPAPRGIESLGVGRFDDWRGLQIDDAEQAVLELDGIPPFLWIRKSHTESWVYRPGQCDHILIQCFDASGSPNGLFVIEGLFSFQALAEPRTDTPLLDRVIDQIFAQLQATKGSHRYRTIRNAFNSLPLEYLFSLQRDDIRHLVQQVIEVDAERRLQTHISIDDDQKIAFVFVALPRSHYSDELRADIRRLLKERFRATSVDDGVYAGNVDSITFHVFLTGVADLSADAQEDIRREIEQLACPWTERLYDALKAQHGVERARELHTLYSEAFPPRYREATSVARAVADISILESLNEKNRYEYEIFREKGDARLGVTRLRMFEPERVLLSDILPILDNFGLIVIDQFPISVQVPGRQQHVIATFRIRGVQNMRIDLLTRRNRLKAGIRAVMHGAMSNDPLNRLLLRADIPWTYVTLMRAYQHYARQLGLPYAQPMVQEALLSHSDVVRALTEFFRAKFDPSLEGLSSEVDEKRIELQDRSRRAVLSLLAGVEDLTSDEILRTFYNLIDATVRTNFYARAPLQQHHISLKVDPAQIKRIPEPRPFREIYVHHPKMSGLHLRGGMVARGGLRWSDRKLDFRTEVLGLMATQNLKNVLIVPRGAKGAFVLRYPPADPSERRSAGDEAYGIFIRGILDVTDNLIDNEVVHPEGIVCHDGLDHYLVVAADKGTAHQSDHANSIAEERGFWLGDAFASGGSSGYDHKKEGITARGAWECVKRHFHELGLHPERDSITAVGIGDMSGDVFGNGMLRSKTLKLVAAFDHRNIFLDPTPDAETSYAERLRLFGLKSSSWKDYDTTLISQGGGVYPRGAKAITLSPEAQRALGIHLDEPISGNEVIRCILRAPVDLLWNGGIGTYIKAGSETHAEAGDASNDDVRVDAGEVRARVIGEGGNLGLTQRGRIQLAKRGVHLNTDAVDNSAGVDLSDHEVNLKILFQSVLERGDMTREERDQVMEEIKEEVNDSVLRNNWIQSRMLSLDERRAQRDLARFYRALSFLSERVPFQRRELLLPSEQTFQQRQSVGEGLMRPELAILAANAKLDLKQEMARDPDLGAKRFQDALLAYFPKSVAERFRDDILAHPLAGNIAQTIITNEIIGDVGCSWLAETTLMTSRPTREILSTYLEASACIDAPQLKREIEALEWTIKADTEYELRLVIEDALELTCNWLLRRADSMSNDFQHALRQALIDLPSLWSAQSASFRKARDTRIAAGVDEALAEKVTALEHIEELLDIAHLATDTQESLERCTHAMQLVGHQSNLLPMITAAQTIHGTEALDRPARIALSAQLRRQLGVLARALLHREADLATVSAESRAWLSNLEQDIAPLLHDDQPICNLVVAADRVERHCRALNIKST